jgi:hypothetical protein
MMIETSCNNYVFHLSGEKVDYFTFRYDIGSINPVRGCFMGKDQAAHNVEYMKQFFDTYKDKRKYFRLKLIDPHEYTEEKVKWLDPVLTEALEYLDKKGHLENTVINFYSDHGDHISFYGHLTESGKREKSNPFYFLMLPERLSARYAVNIGLNQHALVTHRNLYSTEYMLINRPEKKLNA